MTRAERLAERAKHAKTKLALQRKQTAQLEAQVRQEERTARNRRRFQVGTLADNAGLFAWDNVTLAGVFQVLAALQDCPDPVTVLQGLLVDAVDDALVPDGSQGLGISQRYP